MKKEYYVFSQKLREKTNNGDAGKVILYKKEGLSLYILADGVGGCVADYKASDTCVEQFPIFFEELKELELEKRIETAVYKLNDYVVQIEEPYNGMKSTLIILLVDEIKRKLYYVSLGDSRLYKGNGERFEQITKDDSRSVIKKPNGAVNFIVKDGISKAIGINNLIVHVHSLPIAVGDYFLLATDGFYPNVLNLKEKVTKLGSQSTMKKGFDKLVNEVLTKQNDDATAILVRYMDEKSIDFTEEDVMKIINNEPHEFSSLEINEIVKASLQNAIVNKDEELSNQLLNFMAKF